MITVIKIIIMFLITPLILLLEKVNGLHLPMTTMDAASLHHSMGYPTDPYLSGPPNRKQVRTPSLAFLRTPVSRSFPGTEKAIPKKSPFLHKMMGPLSRHAN